ncbi:hypothetical protein AAG589_12205 [Isoptericola sp. F-RaC21]|uniref:hypothetical protein n=1 Tax=Isoptericola sp. F-RaC21 TaxID=3141452 RepID=UPI00315C3CF9
MTGYLVAIGAHDLVDRVSTLVVENEGHSIAIDHRTSLLYVSRTGTLGDGRIFQGYAMDHERDRMVFADAPSNAIPDPAVPLEGTYFTATIEGTTIRCGRDLYGFVPLVWSSAKGLLLVSDSYTSIIAIRKGLGLPVTPDETTIAGRMWTNSMGAQQLGVETYCSEIKYAPAGTQLRYEAADGSVHLDTFNARTYFARSVSGHAEAVTDAAIRMVRSIKTYAATGGIVSLSLSGGTDSRLCLAAALAADIGDSLHVGCMPNSQLDFEIATDLSKNLHFPLNQPSDRVRGNVVRNHVAANWAGFSMGIYDTLYMPKSRNYRDVPFFNIGGHGAEASKGNYGWRTIQSVGMPEPGLEQAERGLEVIGIEPNDRWGSEWHYFGFRNALHGGRAILSNQYVARPAAQIPLIGLSRSEYNQFPSPSKGAPSVILDTMIKLSPELALLPFDTARKNSNQEFVENRTSALGGRLDCSALSPYTIVGTPTPDQPPLETHLELARSEGFTGGLMLKNEVPRIARPVREFRHLATSGVRDMLDALISGSKPIDSFNARDITLVGKMLALTPLMR